MRAGVAALAAGLLGAGSAAADDRDHSRPAPFDRWDRGLFFTGGAVPVAGLDAGGFGATGEVARGHGRWQLVGDLTVLHVGIATEPAPITGGTAAMTATPPPADVDGASGLEARLGVGGRRLIRAFEPDHSASIEMFVEGGVGLSRTWWNGGGTLTRPDLAFGVGWQVRGFETPLLAIRLGVKAIVAAPVDGGTTAAGCTRSCPPPGQHGADHGFLAHIGVAW